MKKSIKVNYIYSLIYQIVNVLIPLATMPYLSRALGADNIGIYSFVNANVTYFGMMAAFGIATYSQLEVAKKRENEYLLNQFCVESFYTRIFTTLLSIILYSIFCFGINQQYRIFYAISLITLISHAFDFTWICQGLENFKTVTIRNTIVKLVGAGLIFACVHDENDLLWYFAIQALTSLIGNIFLIPTVKSYLRFNKPDFKRIFKHLKGAFGFFLPTVASIIISTADKLMIGWFTIDKVQNGCYEQAMRIENLIFALFSALYITMRPRMAYLFSKGDKEEIDRYVTKSLSTILLIAFPIVIGIIQISDLFVPWFFGDGYDGVIMIMKVVSSWIIIKAVSNCLLEQVILPNEGQMIFTKIIWISAISNVILNFVLIPRFSAVGAAVASLMAEILVLVLSIKQTKNDINIQKVVNYAWRPFISSIGMFVITEIIKRNLSPRIFDTIMLIGVGVFTYCLFEVVLRDRMLFSYVRDVTKIIKKDK